MEGLIGLTQNINTTEAAVRDLSILERMDQRVQQDRDKEMAAQQQQELMAERAYAMSDQLLEKDRNRINARIKMAQRQINDHLRTSGGSRARFMEEGGLSVINGITNDIMRSPEAVQYQENKKNLAKIIELQEKGLGHLISPKDLKSLEDYQNNENGGPITYSGVLAEIKLPPSDQFEYGKEIPPERILSFGSNMLKVKSNFETVYPDKEPTYANIIAFMKEMGYGGMGSNTVQMRLDAQKEAAYARANATKGTSKKLDKNSYLGQINYLKSKVPGGLNIKKLNELYGGDIVKALSKTDSSVNKLIGKQPSTIMSRQRSLSEEGLDWTDVRPIWNDDTHATPYEWMFNDKMGLKNSYEILPHNKYKIATRAFEDQYKIENGEFQNFLPTEDMYRMDGMQISGDNKLDPDDHKGNYKVLGVVTALKANSASEGGKPLLLVNAYDDNGELDEKATAKIDEAYGDTKKGIGGSEIAMTQVIAMESQNGDIFYKEIDISMPQINALFSEALGADDDISQVVDQENKTLAMQNNFEQMEKEEKIRLSSTVNAMEEQVFQDPMFELEGQKYWGAGGGGQINRYPLMKGFYMAADYINNSYIRDEDNPNGDQNIYPSQMKKAIDNELFTQVAIAGGIEDDLKNYGQGNSEERIINKWLTNVNQNEQNEMVQERNKEIAQKWYQMLQLVRE